MTKTKVKKKKLVFESIRNYRLSGTANISYWGGGVGNVTMRNTIIENLELDTIAEAINDGGFGCEAILDAMVDIHELYDNPRVLRFADVHILKGNFDVRNKRWIWKEETVYD